MSTAYLGELRIVSFGFAPKGWALCNGQLLAINQNQALFAILGTTYGGDGRQTFALPNLQGRTAIHEGTGIGLSPRVLGETSGESAHTLLVSEIPAHTHTPHAASTAASVVSPGNAYWAGSAPQSLYGAAPTFNMTMAPPAMGTAGSSNPHDNMPPYLVMNVIIALQGIFPSRN